MPPASSSVTATTPIMAAQNMHCQTGALSVTPDASVSTPLAPESAEVTRLTLLYLVQK